MDSKHSRSQASGKGSKSILSGLAQVIVGLKRAEGKP